MPTFAEQLDSSNATLDALLAAPAPPTVEPVQLTAAEAVTQIANELEAGGVLKERATYLKSVLDTLAKNNFESTSFLVLRVIDDPTQIKPKTENIGTLRSIAAAAPDVSGFSSNLKTTMGKAELIQKLLVDRVALKKSKLTDKLGDIQSTFSLTDDDMNEEYNLRWKVGDLINQLQQAVKLERLVEGTSSTNKSGPEAVPVTTTTSAVVATAVAQQPWPLDMAKAKYDPVKKAYETEPPTWGSDQPSRR